MVTQATSTLADIKRKVRRLTTSASTAALSESDLEFAINTFYNTDFPYGIKLDQMRSVYTFYTTPYIDRYPLDVNYNQGVRAPMYVDGIRGNFFKDRDQFYNMWPRYPTKFQQSAQTLSGTITNAVKLLAVPVQITSPNHGLFTGDVITINDVLGMVELNGNTYTITIIDANNFFLNDTELLAYTNYISGGTWTASDRSFIFTVGTVPILSKEVIIGGVDTSGSPITIADDGNGNLLYQVPNPVVSVPVEGANYPLVPPPALPNQYSLKPIPGMKNLNDFNPGLYKTSQIGTVNYVTGRMSFILPSGISLTSGTTLIVRVSQYQPGRPYSLMFWNNEFTVRPVPKEIHKIEIEAYLSPCQFLETTDDPIVNQWAQYIAYGAAREILRERQDMEGVANLEEGFLRQEALVLERQGVEEINQRNSTIFTSTVQGQGWNNGSQGWF